MRSVEGGHVLINVSVAGRVVLFSAGGLPASRQVKHESTLYHFIVQTHLVVSSFRVELEKAKLYSVVRFRSYKQRTHVWQISPVREAMAAAAFCSSVE
ncbi:hypothetical protein [Halobaculum marinum]|uniref:Uncharacterized protein n=1 Tax=Halobaculum marinum TaxID=3031996 RepID=A0ABD5WWA8_9EURY|nr:hypothetical protein [Halobaculum sp. DT55]